MKKYEYKWESKGIIPVDVHPRSGKLIKSIRTGKHACQKGWVRKPNRQKP